jgi:hypothetical protein
MGSKAGASGLGTGRGMGPGMGGVYPRPKASLINIGGSKITRPRFKNFVPSRERLSINSVTSRLWTFPMWIAAENNFGVAGNSLFVGLRFECSSMH